MINVLRVLFGFAPWGTVIKCDKTIAFRYTNWRGDSRFHHGTVHELVERLVGPDIIRLTYPHGDGQMYTFIIAHMRDVVDFKWPNPSPRKSALAKWLKC
jgi:hypothetical protein